MYLKADCINNAYQELRISGLTVQPSASENETALRKLEGMAHEYSKKNICVGYNFEDEPDLNSTAGIPIEYQQAFELCVAYQLLSIFGKGASPDPLLLQRQSGAFSYLSASTAVIPITRASIRMPVGSGNERIGNRYNIPIAMAPIGCETKTMTIGAVDDFQESFNAYLIDFEEIATYSIESTTGLTIVSDSSTITDIDYRIQATAAGFQQVKITMTTDNDRIEIRVINFSVESVDFA